MPLHLSRHYRKPYKSFSYPFSTDNAASAIIQSGSRVTRTLGHNLGIRTPLILFAFHSAIPFFTVRIKESNCLSTVVHVTGPHLSILVKLHSTA